MLTDLLSPLSPAPCGEDLSFSAEFDRITELRRADDPTLDQGAWVRDLKVADYKGVQALCIELLGTRTKDLRLAAWLTEAMARQRGMGGLAEGLSLCAGLCEAFWDGLHPQADDDGFEQRIGNLTWLLTQVVDVAQTTPLVLGSGDGAPYGQRLIDAVRRAAGDAPVDSYTGRSSGPSAAEQQQALAQALAQTPDTHLLNNVTAATAALAALAHLQGVVDGQLGVDGPNFSTARNALEETEHLATRLAKERGLLAEAEAPGAAGLAEVGGTVTAGSAGVAHAGPMTRAAALAQLREVAAFFRRTEPHSPVAYLADKAAQWGEQPLHVWLRSVMKDVGALAHIEELLGVEPPKD